LLSEVALVALARPSTCLHGFAQRCSKDMGASHGSQLLQPLLAELFARYNCQRQWVGDSGVLLRAAIGAWLDTILVAMDTILVASSATCSKQVVVAVWGVA